MGQRSATFEGLARLIGDTPLMALRLEFRGAVRMVYAKAEQLNLSGSIKDRMALQILWDGHRRGTLKPGDTIIEATSGNTGISLAAIGRALGHPVTIFMPDWMSAERRNLIRMYGATIRLVSAAEGGFLGCIRQAEELASALSGSFLPRQFSNPENPKAHRITGEEIWYQLGCRGIAPDAVVAGVGTGGTLMGVGRRLRQYRASVKVYPLEPASSPTLSTGHKVGSHRIQGISDEFIPPIMDLPVLDQILQVEDGDAILMAQRLGHELGLAVGISSGANLLGALKASELLGPEAVVVTFFPDDNRKYLSTDLARPEPPRPGYLAPEVRFLGLDALERAGGRIWPLVSGGAEGQEGA